MNNLNDEVHVKKPVILIVEDNEVLRSSLQSLLDVTFTGCCFLEAKTGEDAVYLASTYIPDVILMDINLPGMSGIEVTKIIKNRVPQTFVIILSFYEFPCYKNAAIEAGANIYIKKQNIHCNLIPVLTDLLKP